MPVAHGSAESTYPIHSQIHQYPLHRPHGFSEHWSSSVYGSCSSGLSRSYHGNRVITNRVRPTMCLFWLASNPSPQLAHPIYAYIAMCGLDRRQLRLAE
ncbi:hypothetical protein SCLCIDRAFT_1223684 [Scleroderma citrinum Foug A]|uniref:Uncharacterized protein n=1 Tax=Scleroderma citrinum Foug A TaxID=1036808 RepID=A0A0C2YRZ3_9AGAM|nr:hypothetical protein SCLCIDRAFT_1223684 [Scleroderma citrinum Foug A]